MLFVLPFPRLDVPTVKTEDVGEVLFQAEDAAADAAVVKSRKFVLPML